MLSRRFMETVDAKLETRIVKHNWNTIKYVRDMYG